MTTTAPVRFGNPDRLYDPSSNGYSHVATVAAGTRLVFVAGQGGEQIDGTLADDFAAQVTQAFDNVSVALAWAGATMDDVVKFTVLVVEHDEKRLGIIAEALSARFHEAMKPTCTLIPVPRLALDGMLVEVEAVAVAPVG